MQMLASMNFGPDKYAILATFKEGPKNVTGFVCVIKVMSDAPCPQCREEDETSLHVLGRCSATMTYFDDRLVFM